MSLTYGEGVVKYAHTYMRRYIHKQKKIKKEQNNKNKKRDRGKGRKAKKGGGGGVTKNLNDCYIKMHYKDAQSMVFDKAVSQNCQMQVDLRSTHPRRWPTSLRVGQHSLTHLRPV